MAMELTEERVEFPDIEPRWQNDRDSILFLALVDKQPVRCVITMEALNELYKSGFKSEECIKAFHENWNEIKLRVNEKIVRRDFNYRGEVVIKSDDPNFSVPPKPIVLFFDTSSEIRNNPNLDKLIKKANHILFFLVVNSSTKVHVYWEFAGKEKNVVQLSMSDETKDIKLLEWFVIERLMNEEFMRVKLEQMWGDFLERLSHQQLQEIMGKKDT